MVSKEHSNQDGCINAYRNPTQDVLYVNASRVFYLSPASRHWAARWGLDCPTGVTRINLPGRAGYAVPISGIL